MQFSFITYNKDILGGKPIVVGTRISIAMILEWLGTGATIKGIYEKYPQLPEGSVEESILYASQFSNNEILIEEPVKTK
jgi:uncharacterized protein (DUF433 family)